MQDKNVIKLTDQDAALLEQGASMLEGLENDERNRGNCSTAEGAGCSAHAVRRLASALLTHEREIGQCLHQIQEPEADIWPCVNIDVDDSGKITNAKLYSPGLPAGNHDVYPVRVPYMDEHTEAWRACVDELEKAVPGFMSLGNMNGIECAVAAIRGLSERAKHQEPAAAEQAAWHAGLDEGRAQAARPVFVPDDMPSTEANTKYGESYGVDWVYEGKTAAPAAVAWSMPAEPTEQMIEVLMAGEDRLRARHGDDLPKQRAKDRYRALLSLAATPACDTPNYCRSVQRCTAMDGQRAAAAPVVLPEPVAWMATPVMQSGRGTTTVFCSDKRMADQWDYGGHPEYGRMLVTGLFTEQQVRALLATATGLPAQAVETVQMPPVTPEQFSRDIAELTGDAQADARDAICELIAKHSEELEHNAYAYFELAYTRRTGWMAWITDKPLNGGPVINPDRKVLCKGQGDTPEEACSAAIAAAKGETK